MRIDVVPWPDNNTISDNLRYWPDLESKNAHVMEVWKKRESLTRIDFIYTAVKDTREHHAWSPWRSLRFTRGEATVLGEQLVALSDRGRKYRKITI